jgi:hypothetical protein
VTDPAHGTIEGFRLHKRNEHPPCPACIAARDALLEHVRVVRRVAQANLGPVAPLPNFSAYQRTRWPQKRAAERAIDLAEHPPPPPLPPVVLKAEPCVGLESWMPQSPRTNLKAFRKAGWEARLTRAAGPRINALGLVPPGKEVVYTIALAAQKGSERVVMVWEYKDPDWKLDSVMHNQRGVIKSTDLKEIL